MDRAKQISGVGNKPKSRTKVRFWATLAKPVSVNFRQVSAINPQWNYLVVLLPAPRSLLSPPRFRCARLRKTTVRPSAVNLSIGTLWRKLSALFPIVSYFPIRKGLSALPYMQKWLKMYPYLHYVRTFNRARLPPQKSYSS
jgi:hypothetical protein